MAENTPGVIAQARAAATAVAPVSQPVAQPVAAPAPQLVQQPQGFGTGQVPNGFAPQPIQQPVVQPVEQVPVAPIATDNPRTAQQFEKLTDNNQRLSSTNQQLIQANELLRQEMQRLQQGRQQSQQQFAPVQQVQPAQSQQQQAALPKLSDYTHIDPVTGERWVDEARFNSDYATASQSMVERVSRAEQVVQNYVQTAQQRELAREEREAYSAYPQLNPQGGQFDTQLFQATRAVLVDSFTNPQDYGGRPLGYKEAADRVSSSWGRPIQNSTQTPAVPTPTVNIENQVQKEQAAVSVPNTPQQVTQNIDADREFQRLVQGTRLGSDEAIAVRLLHTPHRIVDSEGQ